MKKRMLMILLLLSPLFVYGASLNIYLEKLIQQRNQGALTDNSGVSPDHLPQGTIPSHIMVWGQGDAGAVQARGGKVINSHYPYFTALIPTDKLEQFKQETAVIFMKGGIKAHTLLNKAALEVRADQTFAAGYKGNDVIIGVIDDSIDPYHKDFYNDNGMSRILNIWEQGLSGQSPSLFDYGHEWSRDDIDNQRYNLNSSGFHGTHVTGIAAGNGSWSDGLYRGISPEANIIMVQTEGFLNQIINGVEYIMQKAKQLNKPCVINISMGFHFGNHQADDPFNQYMEQVLANYGAEGNVIVWAAGNEGSFPLHATNMITTTNTSISFTTSASGGKFSFYYPNDSRIAVSLERNSSTIIGYTTGNAYSSFADLTIEDYTATDKVVYVQIKDNGLLRKWKLYFQTSAQPIPVHAYIENYDPSAAPVAFDTPISNGTISVSACMQNSITVGSYISRSVYTNYLGSSTTASGPEGQISDFSSLGPTRDGQLKPEVVAPGEYVISTLSSQAASVSPGWIIEQGKYFAIAGTSMAAPVVTGIVAQLLEQDPTLTVDQVRSKLIQYVNGNVTYKPSFGPGNWDARFGYGLAAVDGILMETGSGESIKLSVKNNVFKPDAATDQLFEFLVKSLSSTVNNETIDVKIYTGRGGLVKSYSPQLLSGVGVLEYEWNGQGDNGKPVPAGLYFILVKVGSASHRYPVLIVE